jgi:hypothetical protein
MMLPQMQEMETRQHRRGQGARRGQETAVMAANGQWQRQWRHGGVAVMDAPPPEVKEIGRASAR